ncbi:MAG TPA: cytochrome c oxidase assembly protein [Alphaproteobacteria bacterium]|nr:cytochrome c oxidase assembly protein [Alphaproteobacteria bacterium]
MTPSGRNRLLFGGLLGVALGMVALSFAAVPLYRVFCQVTGYGGTTRRASAGADRVLDRTMEIRFNADVNSELPWSFRPERRSVTVKVGETTLATFHAQNLSGETITGSAVFNVTPDKAGKYFVKIQCFCFTQQVLRPQESADLPVSFYVDPAIAQDRNLDDVSTITLSYTFYRAPSQSAATDSRTVEPAAKSPAAAASGAAALAPPSRVE